MSGEGTVRVERTTRSASETRRLGERLGRLLHRPLLPDDAGGLLRTGRAQLLPAGLLLRREAGGAELLVELPELPGWVLVVGHGARAEETPR